MGGKNRRIVPFRWVLLVVLLSIGLSSPLSVESQVIERGYWVFVRHETPPDTWVGDKFRGLAASWEPFYNDEFSIGGVYQETTKTGSGKDLVWLTEKATCVWTWGLEMPAKQLNPLDPLNVVITAEASAEGPGTVFSGAIATLNYGQPNSSAGLKTVVFAQANIDKLSSEPTAATREQEYILNVPVGNIEGDLMVFELTCGVGNSLGKVSTRWVYQWKVERQAVAPTQIGGIPTNAPPIVEPWPTEAECEYLTPEEKLRDILDVYYKQIKGGPHPVGITNNLVWVYSSKMDKWTCGSYQRQVLDLLNGIRFNKDRCVAGLMDDWDYGPIQAFYGGHQAVVIYPKGKNWLKDGIVLDPWIRQTPKAYTIYSWMTMMTLGLRVLGDVPGIGPSITYDTGYPLYGSIYVNPRGGLTNSEKKYVEQQSEAWRKKFYAMNLTEQKEYLDRIRQQKIRGTRVVGHCPLDFYVEDANGSRTGLVNGVFVNDLAGVYYVSFPLEDGTYWTQIEYDPDLDLKLVMQGTGEGSAELFVGLSQFNDDPALDQSEAFHLDVNSGQIFSLQMEENALVESGDQQIVPIPMDEIKAAEMVQNLVQPDLSTLVEVYGNEEEASVVQTSSMRRWILIGGGLLCCQGVLAVLVTSGVIYYFKRRKTNP